jgi:hypothetical protein
LQVFIGERTGSLYFALVEGRQRMFGIDRENGQGHLHPYDTPEKHLTLNEGLGPKPLLAFLSKVENLLLEHDLL